MEPFQRGTPPNFNQEINQPLIDVAINVRHEEVAEVARGAINNSPQAQGNESRRCSWSTVVLVGGVSIIVSGFITIMVLTGLGIIPNSQDDGWRIGH